MLDAGDARDCSQLCRSINEAYDRHNRWWRLRKLDEVTPATLQVLVSRKLLSALPVDPGQGPGSERNFSRSSYGPWITCRVHTGWRPPVAPAAPGNPGTRAPRPPR